MEKINSLGSIILEELKCSDESNCEFEQKIMPSRNDAQYCERGRLLRRQR